MIDIKLTSKPISEPITYNAYYKLVLLLALLDNCTYSPKKAPLSLIQLVFWGLRNEINYRIIVDFAKKRRSTLIPWSFESGLDKVLTLSFIKGFCKKIIIGKSESLEIQITEEGKRVLKEIKDLKLFEDELIKIESIGKLTKSRINKANSNWKLS